MVGAVTKKGSSGGAASGTRNFTNCGAGNVIGGGFGGGGGSKNNGSNQTNSLSDNNLNTETDGSVTITW